MLLFLKGGIRGKREYTKIEAWYVEVSEMANEQQADIEPNVQVNI